MLYILLYCTADCYVLHTGITLYLYNILRRGYQVYPRLVARTGEQLNITDTLYLQLYTPYNNNYTLLLNNILCTYNCTAITGPIS